MTFPTFSSSFASSVPPWVSCHRTVALGTAAAAIWKCTVEKSQTFEDAQWRKVEHLKMHSGEKPLHSCSNCTRRRRSTIPNLDDKITPLSTQKSVIKICGVWHHSLCGDANKIFAVVALCSVYEMIHKNWIRCEREIFFLCEIPIWRKLNMWKHFQRLKPFAFKNWVSD